MDDRKSKITSENEVLEMISNPSLREYLQNEENCNFDEIFDEISKLTSSSEIRYRPQDEDRSIEDILKEAQALISQPLVVSSNHSISCESTPLEIKNNILDQYDYSTATLHEDDTSDRTLLNDQLDTLDSCPSSPDTVSSMKSKKSSKSSGSKKSLKSKKKVLDEIEIPQIESPERIIEPENLQNNDVDVQFEFDEFIVAKVLCDKSTAPSPTHSVVSSSSFASNWEREREFENTNEKLKDTEERLQSLRIQYDSLSTVHRALRENYLQMQDESDKLKIDHQILTECANVLRCEVQAAKKDHEAAVEIQKILQQELDENRVDKKKFQEITERDSKTIQDLQRQCKEMERILMRKHPDSVSALIVASNHSNLPSQDTSLSTRRLLEERIAQLEADAKEQDKKAQTILASVQARFKTVQAKYENHIQDLETQVLSIQQINLEVSRELTAQQTKAPGISESTQTLDVPEREGKSCRTIGCQTSSTSNPPSRAGSSTSINSTKKSGNKIPNSHSDSNIPCKDDAHLLATLRGMRVELAIKEKAVQRLTRDLDDCKKTVKKLQTERDKYLSKEKLSSATTPKKTYNPANYTENADTLFVKEAAEKIKTMEGEYKSLVEKRIKDLKTLQYSHEKELSACHETIRILQSRLEEQSAKILKDKRRGPIDYFALKAKVSNLERRHSEREKSLHLLIDALSNGKLHSIANDSLEGDSSSSPHSCSSPITKNL